MNGTDRAGVANLQLVRRRDRIGGSAILVVEREARVFELLLFLIEQAALFDVMRDTLPGLLAAGLAGV
jgi:hypothetical protein